MMVGRYSQLSYEDFSHASMEGWYQSLGIRSSKKVFGPT